MKPVGSRGPELFPSSLRCCSPSFPQEVDASNYLPRMIRFFERTIIAKIARLVGSPVGSGGQDDINARVMLANPARKTEAVHSAPQPHLGKDHVDLLPGTEYGHDVCGCDTLENPVSAVAQIACNNHPNQDVELHDQYRAWGSVLSALVIYGHRETTPPRIARFPAPAQAPAVPENEAVLLRVTDDTNRMSAAHRGLEGIKIAVGCGSVVSGGAPAGATTALPTPARRIYRPGFLMKAMA